MDNYLARRLLALTLILGSLGLVLIALGLVYQHVVLAQLTVVASPGSTITVTTASDGRVVSRQQANGQSTTLAVGTGDYVVTVKSEASEWFIQTSAELFHRDTLRYTPPAKLATVTVLQHVAYNPIVSARSIGFLNTSKQTIERVDQSGKVTELDTPRSAATITNDDPGTAQELSPISGNRAIVISADKLYLLQANKLAPIDMNDLPISIDQMRVATSPNEESFALIVNQILYWYSSPSAAPQKVSTFQKRVDQIAYGGSKVIAYSTRVPQATEDISYAYSQYAVDPILVDVRLNTQKVLTYGPIVDASISADGSYATIEPQGADSATLYNLKNLTALYSIASPEVTTPVWVDGSHFVYGSNDAVWKFDVHSRIGFVLGVLPANMQATSITFGSGSYYVTTYDNEDTATIFRLAANDVDQNALLAENLAQFNQSNRQFQFTYNNIVRPTLLVTTGVLSNNPTEAEFWAATMQSRRAALSYLRANGVDPAKLDIVYDPANP